MKAAIAPLSLGFLFVACMPSGGSPSGTDDGGIEIVDAGLGGGDNGETHEDAGTGDAGLTDGGDTSASDAGTPVDGGALPGDGGFTLPDGGVSEYVGEAEVGVVCG
ncbi:MAG: hypothetical protein ACO3JL_14935, partial [Myxococcota bacterium]